MSHSHERCIGEPVSWLRLEGYVLDELPPGQRVAVADHLRACPACAEAERMARQPLSLAGEVVAPARTSARETRPRLAVRVMAAAFGSRPAGIASRLALVGATALAISVARRPTTESRNDELTVRAARIQAPGGAPERQGIKGGGVSVQLVRQREGNTKPGATTFAPDDRWKVLVTCPFGRVRFWDVVVRDGADLTFPLSPSEPITCGNRVPLRDALRIAGTRPHQLCVLLDDAPIDRAALTARSAVDLGSTAACVTLEPKASR